MLNSKFDEGVIKFSFIKQDGMTETASIVRLSFKPKTVSQSTVSVKVNSPVNTELEAITLAYEDGLVDISGPRGDLDGNGSVTSDDAIYLLFHTFSSAAYPLNQPCDFDKSGQVNSDDAIYLLFHTFNGSTYPLD